VEIIELALQRLAQLDVLFQATAALQQLLSVRLVLPEVGGGDAFFYPFEFDSGASAVKDGSAGRRRGAPGLDTCEADLPVEEPWAMPNAEC